jgi:hypothetical protein
MLKNDRREIKRLLLAHFPTMELATSDEWHGFLNSQTGLDLPLDMPNAIAFDKWREALSAGGLPVWGITPERIAAVATKGAALKAAEQTRKTNEAAALAAARLEAPDVSARDLLK